VKTKLCVLALVALIAWGLKRHYADSRVDDLWWILSPTAQAVHLMTGTAFAVVPGEGYFSRERLFLIEKSCAGINFMIAAFAMVAFTLLHRIRSAGAGAGVLGVSLLASYAAAVIVNTVRISIAMWLAAHPVTFSTLTAADVHRFEGILVYFGGLVLLYEVVRRVNGGGFRHLALPLACYYAITLAVPLANGAAQAGDAFLMHALVVLLVPLVLIGVVYAMLRIAQRVTAAVQLTTTVSGAGAVPSSVSTGRGIRNRWPSGDTA
jgi:exosortase K